MEREDSLIERPPGAEAHAVQYDLISREPSIGTAASGRKRRRRRAVASPTSTSGVASAFEHRVARIFLADLLTETGSDWFPSGRIVGVAFQQAVHGIVIDDIVIEYELAGDREIFDLDVKSGLDFIPSDEDYLDVLDGCLDRYSNLVDRPGIYGFATMNENRPAKLDAIQDILKRARNECRAENFRMAIESPGHGDKTLRKTFRDLESAIKNIEPQITPSEMHNFLQRFYVLSFGAGLALNQAEQAALQKVRRTFSKSDIDAKHILQALQTIAAEIASTSGYANLEILTQKLREMDIRLETLSAIGASSEEATTLQIAVDAARTIIPESHGFGNIFSLGAIAIDSLRDEIGSIRADLRGGRLDVAEARLAALRSPARWSLLPANDKARAIALEARLSIATTGRFDKATQLLEEAVSAAPDSIDVIRLRLSLISETEGIEVALNQFPASSDLGLLQLRAAMLLESGRSSEALDLLNGLKRDGETSRLLILCYLVNDDVTAALEIARASAILDPDYAGLTLAIGITEYNAALTNGAPRALLGGPAPVPQAYVRSDPDARRALVAAEKTLSVLRLKQVESAVLEIVNAFWLATLIVQEKTAEATHALGELLQINPKALLLLSWALLRNLPFDIDATIRALEACEASADVATLDVLAQCYVRNDRGVDARNLLLRNELVFTNAGQLSLYYALLLNVYLDLDQDADAAKLLEKVPEPLCSQLSVMLFEHTADKTKTFDALVSKLSESYEKKPSLSNLMHLALVLQRAERYADLGQLSSDLLAVGSSEANALALSGLYNSGQFAEFVAIVSKSPLGELKPHIRLAYAQALDRLGKVQDAAEILESQLSSTIDVAAVSLLGRLLVRLGDVRRLRRLVTFILELETFPPDAALALANSLFFVERTQAVKLWRTYAKDVSDDAVSFTLSLGYRLGLDADPLLGDLTARLVAGAGGAQRYDLEQLREVFSQAAEANEQNSEQYERGFLTVHMLAEANRISIPSLYGAAFDTGLINSKKPLLLASHGGRSLDQVSLAPDLRLNVDITSLLILDKLALWDLACSNYTVRLPYEVFDILQKMLEDLAPNQPSIVTHAEEVITLLDLGQLPDIPSADLSSKESAETVSLNTVPGDGRLSLEMLQGFISSGHAIPERLYFEPGVLHAIDFEVLEATLRRARVVVTTEEVSSFRSERRARAERARVFGWVSAVTSKLQDGLDSAFTLLPAIVTADPAISASSPLASLMSLLRQSYDNRDAIVIDDRYVSSFLNVEGGIPTVTTFDLLRHLYRAQVISQSSYEAHVLQLLGANGFIWPFEDAVLAAALGSAMVSHSGELIETVELRTIRRYVARLLQFRERLQRPGQSASADFPYGELAALLNVSRAIGSTFVRLWSVPMSELERNAKADYMISMLYFDDQPSLHVARVLQPSRSSHEVIALALTNLVLRAMESVSELDKIQAYVTYVAERILLPRFIIDPDFIHVFSNMLRSFIVGLLGSAEGDERIYRTAVISSIISTLPRQVMTQLAEYTDVVELIGMRSGRVITEGECQFVTEELWLATEAALTEARPQVVSEFRTSHKFQLTVAGNLIHLQRESQELTIEEPVIALFGADADSRRAFVTQNRSWFDVPFVKVEQLATRVVESDRWMDIMTTIAAARNSNVGRYYQALSSSDEVDFNEIPEALDDILDHLRLPPSTITVDDLDAASRDLVSEFGVGVAVSRLAPLPFRLSEVIVQAMSALPADELDLLAERLMALGSVPTSLYNLANLFSRVPEFRRRHEFVERIWQAIMRQLDDDNWVAGYLELISWTSFLAMRADSEIPIGARELVAWYHASRLYDMYVRAGQDEASIREMYAARRLTDDRLSQQVGSGHDPSFGTKRGYKVFVLLGFLHGASEGSFEVDSVLVDRVRNLLVYGGVPSGAFVPASSREHVGFLCDDICDKILRVLGEETAQHFEPENIRAFREAAIQAVEGNCQQQEAWLVLSLLDDLNTKEAVRLGAVIREFRFATMVELAQGRFSLLRRILRIPGLLSEESTREHVMQEMLVLIRGMEPLPELSDITQGEQDVAELLNDVATSMALFEPTEGQRNEMYAGTLTKFSARWPRLLKIIKPYILWAVRNSTISRGESLSNLLLAVRAF